MVVFLKKYVLFAFVMLFVDINTDSNLMNTKLLGKEIKIIKRESNSPKVDSRFGLFGPQGFLSQLFPNQRPLSTRPFNFFGPFLWGQEPEQGYGPPNQGYFPSQYQFLNQNQRPNVQYPIHNPHQQYPYQNYPNYNPNQQYPNYRPNYPDYDYSNNEFPNVPHYPVSEFSTTSTTTEQASILGKPVMVSSITLPPDQILFNENFTESPEQRQCVQDCDSTSEYNPICGSNNVTYFNPGKFKCARECGIDVFIKIRGRCAGNIPRGL